MFPIFLIAHSTLHFPSIPSTMRMRWFLLVLAVGMAKASAQDLAGTHPPHVTLTLPAGVPDADATLQHFLRGGFGGYGSEIGAADHRLDLEAAYENKPAREMKAVVFLRGCEPERFDFNLVQEPNVVRQLACKSLPNAKLFGQLPAGTYGKDMFVDVRYLADWVNRDFGVMDGIVPMIHVAEVPVRPDGSFNVDLPAYAGGEFVFRLRDTRIQSLGTELHPVETTGAPRKEYPAVVAFTMRARMR